MTAPVQSAGITTLLQLHEAVKDALNEWGNVPVRVVRDYEHEIRYADIVDGSDGLFFEIGLEPGK